MIDDVTGDADRGIFLLSEDGWHGIDGEAGYRYAMLHYRSQIA